MSRRALTAALVVLAACTLSPATAAAAPRGWVVGGPAVDVQSAPWQVAITVRGAAGVSACGGAIIAADLVVTAAHCVDDATGAAVPPQAVTLRAGTSDRGRPDDLAVVQRRLVSEVRVHPYRNLAEHPHANDVAVLRLAAPLVLGTPWVQAVALPPPGLAMPRGLPGTLAGFGRQAAGAPATGRLHRFDGRVGPAACAGWADAVLFCASSVTSSTCSGDSGSGFVVAAPQPVLAGIAVAGPPSCAPGTLRLMTRVAAPEILAFVLGDPAPPRAPRATGPAVAVRAGGAVVCRHARWRHATALSYTFFDGAGRTLAATRASRYRLSRRDAGRAIGCRVTATSPGGTGVQYGSVSASGGAPGRQAGSTLVVQAGRVSARRGRRAYARVALDGVRGRSGSVRACVAAVPRTSTRACRTVRLLRRENARRFRVPVRVRRAARPGTYRLRVTVTLRPGSALRLTTVLRVRR